ncbi:hypothetical protein EDD21DRAFT_151986 [Dissophora ornata]|nr:hypothetical protein EDD21DRAFT_151986 [Dissophora ornata]
MQMSLACLRSWRCWAYLKPGYPLEDIPLPFSWMTALSDTVQWKRLSELWIIFDSTRFREHTGAIPLDIELGYVPISHGGQYPGLYISYTAARIMRLVKCLANGKVNMVGSFEQVYMEIDCMDDEDCTGENTHQELAPTSMLRIVANLTTFFEFNKSPRNMYQCQMGKQAMGTPATAIKYRVGNKMYRFQTARRLSSILLFITPTVLMVFLTA